MKGIHWRDRIKKGIVWRKTIESDVYWLGKERKAFTKVAESRGANSNVSESTKTFIDERESFTGMKKKCLDGIRKVMHRRDRAKFLYLFLVDLRKPVKDVSSPLPLVLTPVRFTNQSRNLH